MKQTASLQWLREGLWLLLTLIVIGIVLSPVLGGIKKEYLINNAMFIAFAFTYFRYTVFLGMVPYLKPVWTRVLLIIINIILFFQALRLIQEFMFVIDNYTISNFLTTEHMFEFTEEAQGLYMYFKKSYIVSSTSATVLLVICTLRVAASLWNYSKEYREGNLNKQIG